MDSRDLPVVAGGPQVRGLVLLKDLYRNDPYSTTKPKCFLTASTVLGDQVVVNTYPWGSSLPTRDEILARNPHFETPPGVFKNHIKDTLRAQSPDRGDIVYMNVGSLLFGRELDFLAMQSHLLGFEVFAPLAQGQGTVRFYMWSSDLPKLYPMVKRVDMQPGRDVEQIPEHQIPMHVRCLKSGIVVCQGPNAAQRSRLVPRGYGPISTVDYSFAYGHRERQENRQTQNVLKARKVQTRAYPLQQQQHHNAMTAYAGPPAYQNQQQLCCSLLPHQHLSNHQGGQAKSYHQQQQASSQRRPSRVTTQCNNQQQQPRRAPPLPEEMVEYHRSTPQQDAQTSPTPRRGGVRYDFAQSVASCDLCGVAEGAARLPTNTKAFDTAPLPGALVTCGCPGCVAVAADGGMAKLCEWCYNDSHELVEAVEEE